MSTFLNGEELVAYDKFVVLLHDVDAEIASAEGYAGYPDHPSRYFDAKDLFEEANDKEKEWMFSLLWGYFCTALRHWKSDIDKLYTEDGRKKHEEFLQEYQFVLPHMGKQTSFDIGM